MENTTTRITSLEEHRKLLRTVFETARNRVLVVSPFISKSAIDYDRVPELVNKATRRGVSVDIYTDDALNLDSTGSLKPAARDGVASLLRAGAQVTIVQGIHNKTLARDSDLIAEGSFNWLSAVRTSGGTHQREERTMVVEGEQASEMIEEEAVGLEKRIGGIAHIKEHAGPQTKDKGALFKKVLSCVAISILVFLAMGIKGLAALCIVAITIYILDLFTNRNRPKESDTAPDEYLGELPIKTQKAHDETDSLSTSSQQYWFFWDDNQ